MKTASICLLLFALYPSLAAAKSPNILFIYTDDHSYRTLSCYEHAEPWARTPNIDRLGRARRAVYACLHRGLVHAFTRHQAHRLRQYGAKTMRMEDEYPDSEYDPAHCLF